MYDTEIYGKNVNCAIISQKVYIKMQSEKITNATKIQRIINTLKEKEAVFQSGHWSSAEDFEHKLRTDGFIPPVPISHKYNFPTGMSEKEYEDMAMWLTYIIYFDPTRIYDTQKYVDTLTRGSSMTDEEKQAYYDKMVAITGELSDAEKDQIVRFFTNSQENAIQYFSKMTKNLQNANPEIADIKINPGAVQNMFDLAIGATSRFHPDDIKYYMSLGDIGPAQQNQRKIGDVLGYAPHIFIEPSRVNQIINGIIIQRNMHQGRTQQ